MIYQDASIRQRLAPYIPTYPGLIFSGFRASPADQPNTVFFPLRQGMGFARDLTGGWFVGKSTTYAAAQLALWMGYPRVSFLGVDMGEVDGKLWHYAGGNPDISRAERLPRFDVEARYWDHAAIALRPDERERFTFASSYNPYPFVNAFRRADHRGIVAVISAASYKSDSDSRLSIDFREALNREMGSHTA